MNINGKQINGKIIMLFGFAFILSLFILQQNSTLSELGAAINENDMLTRQVNLQMKNYWYSAENLATEYQLEFEKQYQFDSLSKSENQKQQAEDPEQAYSVQTSDLRIGLNSPTISLDTPEPVHSVTLASASNNDFQKTKMDYSLVKQKPKYSNMPMMISKPKSEYHEIGMHVAHIPTVYDKN